MTATSLKRPAPEVPPGECPQTPSLWGFDPRALHDHFWATQGVPVVRGGAAGCQIVAACLYLLLEADDLVLFDLGQTSRPRLRRGRGTVHLRLVEAEPERYSESVIADELGRLISIRRRYTPRTRSALEVLLTKDPALATVWRRARSRRAGWREVRLAAGLHGSGPGSCHGRSFNAKDTGGAFMLALVRHAPDLPAAWPGFKSPQPGVWVHETTVVAPGVRFVPPVWVGAGVTLRSEDLVVGPLIVEDRIRAQAPRRHRVRGCLRVRRGSTSVDAAPNPRRRVGKRLFDIAFSLAALLLTAPLYPLIMLAIWLEDGRPFFFVHQRQSIGGREFGCIKFRVMRRDAERLKAALAPRNESDGPQFHLSNDPRLLRVGRVLRRWTLDELPQFLNVLIGDMSIVGPRPSPDDENQFCPAWREARLSVRAGLTGLWQVRRTRKLNTDFQEWICYDLEYVQRQSWMLDLWIIAVTPLAMLRKPAFLGPEPPVRATPGTGRCLVVP